MRIFPSAKRSGLFLLSFALFAGLIGASPANAVSGPNSTPSTESLFDSEVVTSPESLGRVERDAVKAARAHLTQNASKWGIDPKQFTPTMAIDGVAGMTVVRFGQTIGNLEVANSLLAITVDKNGSLLSHTKSISDFSGEVIPAVSAVQATESLKVKLAENYRVPTENIMVSKIDLVIVDGALVDDVPSGQYLAWRASTSKVDDVTSSAMTYLSEDGQHVLSSLPFVRGINNTPPFVCDLQQTDETTLGVIIDQQTNHKLLNISGGISELPLCGQSTVGRIEDPSNVAITNIDRTWEYFNSVLGIDINQVEYLGNIVSADEDSTSRISAFVNVCLKSDRNYCPYENAFWVPWNSDKCSTDACSGIFLGPGFEEADDVVAHELAHGVTFSLALSSALVDNSETAAISEALSDIFGEAMDQLAVLPGEAPDPAWSIGEDVETGGFRNLRNPEVMKIDKNWRPRNSHDNSGPVNRLAFLLANGGKVGKVKVKALGSNANSVTKNNLCEVLPSECVGTVRMSQLVFATTSNLSATSNYFDFGKQMMNSCDAFVKNKTPGFKKKTCKNVAVALKSLGFTKLKVTKTTKLGTVGKGKKTEITARVSGTTGSPVVGQKMQLQIKQGSKWKTVMTANSDGNGVVGFTAKWNKSATYRIISKTNGGVFATNGKSTKVKVR